MTDEDTEMSYLLPDVCIYALSCADHRRHTVTGRI